MLRAGGQRGGCGSNGADGQHSFRTRHSGGGRAAFCGSPTLHGSRPMCCHMEPLWSGFIRMRWLWAPSTVQALQREQELQLWRQIIERSTSGREMLLPDSAAALASESFRTAFEHGIALDSPLMTASSDTRAFSVWAAEFRRQLAAHGWTCPALFTRELAPCLSSLRLPQQVFVFLAERTPAQCTLSGRACGRRSAGLYRAGIRPKMRSAGHSAAI